MYVLRIDSKIKQGKKDEFVRIWSSHVLPTLKKQAGFVDEILLFDEHTHIGAGISIWNSRKDAERYHQEAFNQTKAPLDHLFEGGTTVHSFEILASETLHITAHKVA